MINLADLFEHVADTVPDRLALVAGDARLTYRELDERANRVAHWLIGQGVAPGEHVGVLSWNRAEWVEVMIGCFKARCAPVNVNYRYTAGELAHLLDDADCVALVGEPDLLERVPDRPSLAIGAPYEKALADASPERGFGPRSPDDPYLLYTGGTTGLPKGVLWRAEDIYLAAMSVYSGPIKDPAELTIGAEGLRFQVHAPLMHGNGQWSTWICLSSGGTVVLWTGRHFDAGEVLALAERERSQVLSFAGDGMAHPVADELLRRPYSLEVFSIGSGGAPLSAGVREKIRTALPDVMVVDSYGGSETGAVGMAVEGARFTLGRGFAVLGADHVPVGPGEQGVLARSGNIPLCYYKDPVKTAATFVTGPDGTRWALQGDHAVMRDDGTAELLGRGSTVIVSGGEKIFPEEVEVAVRSHPDVYDAMVVGAPDERFGQRVTAIVAAAPGREVTLEALVEHCRRELAGFKVPRALVLVPEIQRTPVGKLDYTWARSLLA
ncbi:AMP-binding protein [Nonomuraea sp. NPDC050556]|uniref:AMP-binding protein n=1 Tax=Nonomuraea sp. NPDC050556 TaxID=3364369 RepID=UPI0037889D74